MVKFYSEFPFLLWDEKKCINDISNNLARPDNSISSGGEIMYKKTKQKKTALNDCLYKECGDCSENDIIKDTWNSNPLTRDFFSKKNLNYIQNIIRYLIYQKSNKTYIIDKQDDTNILVIMRQTFLRYYPSIKSTTINKQILELNTLVINEIISPLINEISSYIKFLKDQNSPLSQFQISQATSITGQKAYQIPTDVFVRDSYFFKQK